MVAFSIWTVVVFMGVGAFSTVIGYYLGIHSRVGFKSTMDRYVATSLANGEAALQESLKNYQKLLNDEVTKAEMRLAQAELQAAVTIAGRDIPLN